MLFRLERRVFHGHGITNWVRLLTFCMHLSFVATGTSGNESHEIPNFCIHVFGQPLLGLLDVLDRKEIDYPFDCIALSEVTRQEIKS